MLPSLYVAVTIISVPVVTSSVAISTLSLPLTFTSELATTLPPVATLKVTSYSATKLSPSIGLATN